MIRHYFLVYRFQDPAQCDMRCPIGGVTVHGWTKLAVLRSAWLKARDRFPCRPREVLMIVETDDKQQRKHVQMMEADWERAFADFQELMTVS